MTAVRRRAVILLLCLPLWATAVLTLATLFWGALGGFAAAPIAAGPWPAVSRTVTTSLVLAGLGTGLALLPGFALAWFLFTHAHTAPARALHRLVAASAALPSIVIALSGLIVFAPALVEITGRPFSLALAVCGLALLACPILALGLLGAAKSGRLQAEPAAAALGLSVDERAFGLYLRCARGWVIGAMLWTLLRALGETMVVMMLSGNRLAWPVLPGKAVLAASADIALHVGETPPPQWTAFFLEALALVVIAWLIALAGSHLAAGPARHGKGKP